MKLNSIYFRMIILTLQVAFGATFFAIMVYHSSVWLFPDYYCKPDCKPNLYDYLRIITSTVLSIILASSLSFLFAKKLIRPITRLAYHAREIAEGNLSSKAEIHQSDLKEIETLMRDFNFMAERLDEVSDNMRTWNASIAHELRTPLTILRLDIEALSDNVEAPSREFYNRLLKQTEILSSLVDDLRTITLASTGSLKIYRDSFNLYDALFQIKKSYDLKINHSERSLILSGERFECFADEKRILQAIMALLNNALEYSSDGDIFINCSTENEDYYLSVENIGSTICEEFMESIFQPFYRLNPDDPLTKGSGLGLAVVRSVMMAHGGSVTCSSTCRGGTLFTLRFS